MINIRDKKECNGCCACVDVCPVKAIRLETDPSGFWYPVVDMQTCIDCSLCEKVCPELQAQSPLLQEGESPVCYAAQHRDVDVRKDSTSGGAFTAFAEAVFATGGSVGGAVYRSDFSVQHILSDDEKDLKRLRSSKYLQSNCEGLYVNIKKRLTEGGQVLVCGCPCQMAALRLFLGEDNANLILCDFICRGINSPMVFRKHLDALEEKHHSKVVYAKAKNKEHGWRSLTFKAVFDNGEAYYGSGREDDFTRGYLQTGYYCRPSCTDCKFKEIPRIADITLGDFWGVESVAPALDDDIGTSLVMCNTAKGRAFFAAVQERLTQQEVTLRDIEPGNFSLHESISFAQEASRAFFSDLEHMPFPKAAHKHFPRPKKVRNRMTSKLISGLKLGRVLFRAMRLSPRAWAQFFWLNVFRRNTTSNLFKMQMMLPTPHSVFDIHPSAVLELKGLVTFGYSKIRGSRLETRIRIEEGARLVFEDAFLVYAGGDIQIFQNGTVEIGGGPGAGCNIHCQLVCADRIRIGRGTLIGRNVILRDYDAHYIVQQGYRVKAPVTIGDHCWLGDGAMVCKGVTVGEGSIVAARSWVVSRVPPKTLVAGAPAMPLDKNIEWKA